MKKMFLLLVSLIVLYLSIQLYFLIFKSSYNINYEINNGNETFYINEVYTKNIKGQRSNYLITIKHNDIEYSYQLFKKLNRKNIIKEIEFYSDDNFECILPIFEDDKIIFDITCYSGQNFIDYHNIINKSDSLNNFKNKSKIYSENMFLDNSTDIIKNNLYNIYRENIIHSKLAFTNYKGITIVDKNGKITDVNIFANDKYLRPLSTFTNDYYVVANYNDTYEFDKFYIINLKNNNLTELRINYKISFDSYIQGTINNYVYIFDKDNKVQYKLDTENMNIKEIGNIKNGIKYYENNEFHTIEANKALKEKLLFKSYSRNILDNGTIIDTIDSDKYGYIYTYIKQNDKYLLYISNIQTPNIKKYLFEIKDINSVIYIDEFIYFKDDDTIKYYSELTGKKTIIASDELLFNDNILYNIIK